MSQQQFPAGEKGIPAATVLRWRPPSDSNHQGRGVKSCGVSEMGSGALDAGNCGAAANGRTVAASYQKLSETNAGVLDCLRAEARRCLVSHNSDDNCSCDGSVRRLLNAGGG